MIRLTEQQYKSLIKESVKQYINETEGNDLGMAIQTIMDNCMDIIFRTQNSPVSFNRQREREYLETSQEYVELKNELIKSLENTFNAAKELLAYMAKISNNEYNKKKAMKYLQEPFIKKWR